MTPVPKPKAQEIVNILLDHVHSKKELDDFSKQRYTKELTTFIKTDTSWAYFGLALISTHFDNDEKSMQKYFKIIFSRDSENPGFFYNYAVALNNFGHLNEAHQALAQALDRIYNNPELLSLIAEMAYPRNYHDMFFEIHEKAKEFNITSPRIKLIEEELRFGACESTVFNVADYFLALQDDDGNITNTKLQELCAYAQALSLALIERPLFQAHIVNSEYGPAIPDLYKKYECYQSQYIPNNGLSKADVRQPFDDEQKFALELVNNYYGKYSEEDLQKESFIDFSCSPEINGVISKGSILKTFKNHYLVGKLQDANLITEFNPKTNNIASMQEVFDALRLLSIRVADEHRLPFEVKAPNKKTKDAIAELEKGGGKEFTTIADLMADLNAND